MKSARIGIKMFSDADRTRYNAQHGIHLVARIGERWEMVPIERRRWASSRRKVRR